MACHFPSLNMYRLLLHCMSVCLKLVCLFILIVKLIHLIDDHNQYSGFLVKVSAVKLTYGFCDLSAYQPHSLHIKEKYTNIIKLFVTLICAKIHFSHYEIAYLIDISVNLLLRKLVDVIFRCWCFLSAWTQQGCLVEKI